MCPLHGTAVRDFSFLCLTWQFLCHGSIIALLRMWLYA